MDFYQSLSKSREFYFTTLIYITYIITYLYITYVYITYLYYFI